MGMKRNTVFLSWLLLLAFGCCAQAFTSVEMAPKEYEDYHYYALDSAGQTSPDTVTYFVGNLTGITHNVGPLIAFCVRIRGDGPRFGNMTVIAPNGLQVSFQFTALTRCWGSREMYNFSMLWNNEPTNAYPELDQLVGIDPNGQWTFILTSKAGGDMFLGKLWFGFFGDTVCPADFSENALWKPSTTEGVVNATCRPGYEGTPSRVCTQNGWGPIQNPCTEQAPLPASQVVLRPWNNYGDADYYNGFSPEVAPNSYSLVYSLTLSGLKQMVGPVIVFCFNRPSIDRSEFGIMTVTAPNSPPFTFQFSPSSRCFGSEAQGEMDFVMTGYPLPSHPELDQLIYTNPNGNWTFEISTISGSKPFTAQLWFGYYGVFCRDEAYGFAQWPASSDGVVTGSCQNGYSGNPTRRCSSNGWSTNIISGHCRKNTCAATTENGMNWPSASAFETKTAPCPSGMLGSLSKTCKADGTWDPAVNTCMSFNCPAETYGRASWNLSPAGEVTGTCLSGFSGSPRRVCHPDGVWSTQIINPCQLIPCASGADSGVQWPQVNPVNTVQRRCPVGFTGMASRVCNAGGVWGNTDLTNCAPVVNNCGGGTYGLATFPQGVIGQSATGTCRDGYSGSPQRLCQANGMWSSSVTNYCQIRVCSATTAFNAAFPATQAGQAAYGTCTSGAAPSGRPLMRCDLNGQWQHVRNACV